MTIALALSRITGLENNGTANRFHEKEHFLFFFGDEIFEKCVF
jgi:hypothetical protein